MIGMQAVVKMAENHAAVWNFKSVQTAVSRDAVSLDATRGLSWLLADQALAAWDDVEQARRSDA